MQSLLRAEVLPTPADTLTAFGTGRALVRRVPRENLWIVYKVSDGYVDFLTVKDEPPIPKIDFDPPPPLGTTDRSRYVKIATLEEAQRPELRDWLEQAAREAGWK